MEQRSTVLVKLLYVESCSDPYTVWTISAQSCWFHVVPAGTVGSQGECTTTELQERPHWRGSAVSKQRITNTYLGVLTEQRNLLVDGNLKQ
ncbi:hypothetical protein AOXY_G40 [Acipenser oxyrinchus oxyrinchus]|uniref:Uncharacterized protein n=1 Tax=Acipenser oxyrinchus oxyrinchus TaxID=40147 RepID=A0AAD8LVA6_ACIOX|nr:hypothetical protein AOXY_G40 [Acipenser oxyrinchus oxyrinchus]